MLDSKHKWVTVKQAFSGWEESKAVHHLQRTEEEEDSKGKYADTRHLQKRRERERERERESDRDREEEVKNKDGVQSQVW